jgi:hypothetical protein
MKRKFRPYSRYMKIKFSPKSMDIHRYENKVHCTLYKCTDKTQGQNTYIGGKM